MIILFELTKYFQRGVLNLSEQGFEIKRQFVDLTQLNQIIRDIEAYSAVESSHGIRNAD